MINLFKDIERNFSILFEYSLPLILTVIKLKIEKEYYNFGNIIIKESKNNSLFPETIKLKRIGNYILSNTIGTETFS